MTSSGRLASFIYTVLLVAFPRRYRDRYAVEMTDAFTRELEARRAQGDTGRLIRFCVAAYLDVVKAGLGERRKRKQSESNVSKGHWIDSTRRDLRLAVKSLIKARTFTIVCLVTLSVGIGANVAVVVFLRAITETPPAVHAEGLAELIVTPTGPERSGRAYTWTYPDYVDLRGANTGLDIVGWAVADGPFRMLDAEGTERVTAMYVSDNYFRTLGVALFGGRGFTVEDGQLSALPVAVVSHDFWQERLEAAPDIVGKVISLNRTPFTIIGIAPEGFRTHAGPEGGHRADFWVPLDRHRLLNGTDNLRLNRDIPWLSLIARYDDAQEIEQVNAELSTVMARLEAEYPQANRDKGAEAVIYSGVAARDRFEMVLVRAILLGLTGLILLIVCLNVAGMVLVRSATRERELAIRLAIGSSRSRLVRYLMSEATVIAIAGGFLAVGVIFGTLKIVAWRLGEVLPTALRPDLAMLLVCIALCLVTTLAIGLLPALRFSRPGLFSALRDDAGGGGRKVGKLQRIAAAIQVGVALPFLVVGALYLDEARTTATAEVGFEPQGLYASSIDLSGARYSEEELGFFQRTVRDALENANGISSVSISDGLPLDFVRRFRRIAKVGDSNQMPVQTISVSDGYFETMGTSIEAGRDFMVDDREGTEPVAVVTRALAALLWPGANAVGQQLMVSQDGLSGEKVTIIGVIEDVAASQLGDRRTSLFLPLAQHPQPQVNLVIRAVADHETMASTVQGIVADFDSELFRPVVITGTSLIDRNRQDFIGSSIVSGFLSAIALVLAGFGVYGVVAYMVTGRTREIGVRIAMGASKGRVMKKVLGDAVKLAIPGLVGGTLIVAVFLKVKTDLPPASPLLFTILAIVAASVALAIVLFASLGPAFRASRIPPVEAMRAE